MTETLRIAMWSGPRNISTAMMRSFGSRRDTVVVDEPFYAIYLLSTGVDHPMRAQSIASQAHAWPDVVEQLLGPLPESKTIFYQKHMTHHMVPIIDLNWMAQCRNVFLIRDPKFVIASYLQKRDSVSLSDIGLVRQWELFQREADRLGVPPPVIDGSQILQDPGRWLPTLCTAVGITFDNAMLSWSPGRRDTDGVWAAHWYQNVERSTGFAPPKLDTDIKLATEFQALLDEANYYYTALREHHLK